MFTLQIKKIFDYVSFICKVRPMLFQSHTLFLSKRIGVFFDHLVY